jgi:outer membrane phospholipase A
MMQKIFLALLCLLLPLAAFAAEVAFTLMPPMGPVEAGTDVRVDLAAMNPGGMDQPFTAPISLAGKLIGPAGEREVTLDAVSSGPVAVPPGGFAVRRYHVRLPGEFTGRVVLEVDTPALGVLRTVLDVHPVVAAAQPAVPATAAPTTSLDKLKNSAPAASALARTFAGRFTPNQPIYFLYGNADQAVKFQFSFDYKLATMRWGQPGAEKVTTLRLGYTQRSLWDIDAMSSPFYDTSYMPEIAFNTDSSLPTQHSAFTWLGWRAGFQHESNGKDGADSRSLNVVYLRPRFLVGDIDHWFALVLPEFQTYVSGVEDNPAIKDYRGYGKLKVYLGQNTGPTLLFTGWTGKDFNHPSYQLDLAWPISTHWLSFETFLQMQYFNGYGESLRSYDQKSEALRFGLGLVR